jgi:Fe-S cluster assembly scaffold protein SufB
MLDALDKEILKSVADLEGLPKGAFNIRKNGQTVAREISANINIEANAEGTGIVVSIAPGTKNESVHIPVILTQAGLHDVVYNTFVIGEDSDVTIVAGCGIHCGSSKSEGHAGIHEFQVGKNATVKYVEKHYAYGEGKGKRTLSPTTKVFLAEGARAEMELTQIGGVDQAERVNESEGGPNSSLLITERVMTEGDQKAVSRNNIALSGDNSKAEIISRSVIKGDSNQDF